MPIDFRLRHRRRRLIIGGHDVERGRYPYFASINKNNGVILNGALIAPDIVLSAGHIATNNMDHLTLKVGAYNVRATNTSFAGEEIRVEGWIMHSNWSQFAPEFFANDFCILKLERPSSVAPLRINRNPLVPVKESTVRMLGLGWTNESYLSPSHIVQEVELLTIGNKACENTSDATRGLSYQGLIVPSMICTVAPPNTTRDGCAWDSGAPVILADDSSNPLGDLLVALGSTGVECADRVFPSIQARVSDGYDWIEQQVCELSVDPPSDFHCHKYPKSEAPATSEPTLPPVTSAPTATLTVPVEQPTNATEAPTSALPLDDAAPTSTNSTADKAAAQLARLNATGALATEGQPRMIPHPALYSLHRVSQDSAELGSLAVIVLVVLAIVASTFKRVSRQRSSNMMERASLVQGSQYGGYSTVGE